MSHFIFILLTMKSNPIRIVDPDFRIDHADVVARRLLFDAEPAGYLLVVEAL